MDWGIDFNRGQNVCYIPLAAEEPVETYDPTFDRYLRCGFTIEYEIFPLQIEKKQHRHQEYKEKGQQMRLKPEESEIKLVLTFTQGIDIYRTQNIFLNVKRANKTSGCYDGFVSLDPAKIRFYQEECGSNQISLHANVGELKEEDLGKDIYKLSRNDVTLNQFFVQVEVQFTDGSSSTNDTRTFTVCGCRKGGAKKRRIAETADSPLSNTSVLSGSSTEQVSKTYIEAQKAVMDEIAARTGTFENLYAKVIRSGNGDIAYHFILRDQSCEEYLNPGEVIGFTTDEEGKAVIHKLTSSISENHDVFLKGVVTESQYLEVNKPEDENVITSTICMLGIVPVQVIGPVYPGDGLFASKDVPGVATPEDYVVDKKNDKLIGFALEKDDCPDDEIRDVHALVSMLGGAMQDIVSRDLLNLENKITSNITETSRRHKKRYYFISILIVLFSLALGIGVYQRYGIGTMYQRWACSRGSTGTSEYWYWLQGHLYRGVRFPDCHTVWRKATKDRRFYRRPKDIPIDELEEKCLTNGTYHYYINLDSCTGVLNPGARYMYAVDENCTKVYRFDEVEGVWGIDLKVCASPRCNLRCDHKKSDNKKCHPRATCRHDKGNKCDDHEKEH